MLEDEFEGGQAISGSLAGAGASPIRISETGPSKANRKQMSPPDHKTKRGRNGSGSAPRSLSHAGIRRALAASFPTLFSTASGVFGLVAGPFCALRSQNF